MANYKEISFDIFKENGLPKKNFNFIMTILSNFNIEEIYLQK